MFEISHYRNRPPQELIQQVMSLAAQNTPEMHTVQPDPDNPIYPLVELTMVMEIHVYMDLMGPSDIRNAGLIIAMSTAAPGQVLGFLQYASATNMESACAITYLAVDANHRMQGIARAMMDELMKRHPHAALTCPVQTVPVYESLGFTVLDAKDTQVVMTSGGYRDQAVCTLTDASQFLRHPSVLKLQNELIKEHGVGRLFEAEKQMTTRLLELQAEAEKYAATRLAGATHNEAVAGA